MSTEQFELRRGPWTLDEDSLLIHYIACNGEGRWNLLAKCAGLKRTGKSCRLRWLNYLKPDIKRGNLTVEEQILILELHSKWGNRWSKIAQHLPGRTDNEIKNYWRTRVQKQARQLKIESNSKKFLEAVRSFWMPRLLEKIEQTSMSSPSSSLNSTNGTQNHIDHSLQPIKLVEDFNHHDENSSYLDLIITEMPEISEYPTSPAQAFGNNSVIQYMDFSDYDKAAENLPAMSAMGTHDVSLSDCHMVETDWISDESDDMAVTLWNMDEMRQFNV